MNNENGNAPERLHSPGRTSINRLQGSISSTDCQGQDPYALGPVAQRNPVYLTAFHLDAGGLRFWFRCRVCGRLNSIYWSVLPAWWDRYWCKGGHPLNMILDWRLLEGWDDWCKQGRPLDTISNPRAREWLREIGRLYDLEQEEQAHAAPVNGGDAR